MGLFMLNCTADGAIHVKPYSRWGLFMLNCTADDSNVINKKREQPKSDTCCNHGQALQRRLFMLADGAIRDFKLFILNCTDVGLFVMLKLFILNCTADGAFGDVKTLHFKLYRRWAIRVKLYRRWGYS